MKLPPRKDYPDYYEIIKKPIDITKVVNRIEDGKVIICTTHDNNVFYLFIFFST